jgi:beta-N-acetylhexosaminidase
MTPSPLPAEARAWLDRLTLEQKAGQVLAVSFDGTAESPELAAMIEQQHAGGVIFFARNVAAPEQVGRLTAALQRAARDSGDPGLLMAIDQEGGRVARLTEGRGFTEFPSAMALAATGHAENARLAAQALADEMRAVGVNVDFAPVLDVNANPDNPVIGARSFGSDPRRVAEFGTAFLRGLQAAGVLAIGKHFPGHGDTEVDSHLALPVVAHDRARLEVVDFVPFRSAAAAGVAGLMAAHVAFPALDPAGTPASVASPILTGLLREEWAFAGLVATDSLEMGALANTLGLRPAQAAAAALQAGADWLLFNCGYEQQREAHALIVESVHRGAIPLARLDEAVLRVLSAKSRLGLLDPAAGGSEAVQARVGTAAHHALAEALAIQSITLLRDEAHWLPVAAGARPLVVETPALAGLGDLLGAPHVSLSAEPSDAEIGALVGQVRAGGDPCIVGVAGVARYPAQAALVNALLPTGAPIILVAACDPYDLLAFPRAPCMLATYGTPPPTLRALAAVLRGRARAGGRLPVELPGLFAAGAGVQV